MSWNSLNKIIENWDGFDGPDEDADDIVPFSREDEESLPTLGLDDIIQDLEHGVDEPKSSKGPATVRWEDYENDDSGTDEENAEMETLCSLLRKFFKVSNVEADVEYSKNGIDIYVFYERREKMSTILRAFEVVNKLKRDTLQGYKSEFDIWENRQGYPIMNFRFSFDDNFGTGIEDEDEEIDGLPWT